MNGTLDRTIEEQFCALISAALPLFLQGTQVVPNLRGGGESEAVLPRIVITAQSEDTPELFTIQAYRVNVTFMSMVEATSEDAPRQTDGLNRTIDAVIYGESIVASLNTSRLKIYGVVPGGEQQERADNRLIRIRMMAVHGRLR